MIICVSLCFLALLLTYRCFSLLRSASQPATVIVLYYDYDCACECYSWLSRGFFLTFFCYTLPESEPYTLPESEPYISPSGHSQILTSDFIQKEGTD